jgi:glycogen debranching enzyme
MAGRVLSGLLDASVFMDLQRLPELFCGLHRRPAEGPTLYPVACSPQAWAAGSVFLLLQACLGLAIDGSKRQILLQSPYLPEDIRQLWIKGLEVSGGRVDLFLEWRPEGVRVHVLENKGQIEVRVI